MKNVRRTAAFIFWALVALLLLLAPFLLILWAEGANAQAPHAAEDEVDPESEIVEPGIWRLMPEDMPHPVSGEEGSWIPRWAERAHLIDANRLELCLKDAQLSEAQILIMEDRHLSMQLVLADIEHARDELEIALFAAEKQTEKDRTRLERRLRVVWGMAGASVALLGTTTIVLLR